MDKFHEGSPYKEALSGAQSIIKSQQSDEIVKRRKFLEGKGISKELNVKSSKEEGRDPVLLFPEEVWEKILSDVTKSTDLENCSLSCQLFQKVLKPRRAEWMFTKSFQFLYQHLDKASILNCRLSCNNWTTAVDNHLDQILSLSEMPTYTKIHSLFIQKGISSFQQFLPIAGYYFPHFAVDIRQDQLIYTSRHGIPLSKITPEMELSPRNPFILGRLVVFLDVVFTQQIVSQAILLLENCGDHIWYLEVSPCSAVEEKDIDLKELKRFFSEGLSKMQNLKKLDLLMTRNFVETHLLLIIQNSCKSLQSLSYRLPESENEEDDENRPSALALSSFCQQLQCLELITWKPNYLEGNSWPNLKMLTLWNLKTPEILSGLAKLNLQGLKSLKLNFCYKYNDSVEDPKLLENLLLISNHFSKLTCMEIVNAPRIPEAPENMAALPEDLYGPSHLVELTVHFKDSNNYPNLLNFLLRFPLLKNLYVKNLYDNSRIFRKRLEHNEIDVTGVYNAMSSRYIDDVDEVIYKAEIWKLLPFLQVLGVVLERTVKNKVGIFTRQGYTYRRSERYVRGMMKHSILPLPAIGPMLEDISDWD